MYEEFDDRPNSDPIIRKPNRLGNLAMIAGICAIIMSLAIIPGVLFGILAITLGVISRIHFEKFDTSNVLGITFGIIALFLSAVVFLGTIMLLKDPETMAELQKMMEMYYSSTPIQ